MHKEAEENEKKVIFLCSAIKRFGEGSKGVAIIKKKKKL